MMSATTAARPSTIDEDQRIVMSCVSWDTYERLLADDEGRRVPRMTFDREVLEFVTPSMPHEEDSRTITRLVEVVAASMGVPIRSVGSTTYLRQDLQRGFEPDSSFYVQSEERIRGQREVDISTDPPPDVVLEMEMTRSAINKLALFASMGIPEVWRCDGHRVSFFVLEDNGYREANVSRALPVLTSDVLTRFLLDSRTMLSPDWFQVVTAWARERRASSS